jgi:hypothetical protein
VSDIVPFQMKHNAEAEAVDLLMEVDILVVLLQLCYNFVAASSLSTVFCYKRHDDALFSCCCCCLTLPTYDRHSR